MTDLDAKANRHRYLWETREALLGTLAVQLSVRTARRAGEVMKLKYRDLRDSIGD